MNYVCFFVVAGVYIYILTGCMWATFVFLVHVAHGIDSSLLTHFPFSLLIVAAECGF